MTTWTADVATKELPVSVRPFTKKRKCQVMAITPGSAVSIYGNYHDGGTIHYWTAVCLDGKNPNASIRGKQPFSGGGVDTFTPPRGYAVVMHGMFCGKPAHMTVFVRRDDRLAFALGDGRTAAELVGAEMASVIGDVPNALVIDKLKENGFEMCAARFAIFFPSEL